MKIFIKQSTIYTNKKIKDSNIVCLSDLHYTKSLSPKTLNAIIDKIRNLNPEYICFLGDTTDDKSYDDVISWFNELAKIAPVYFSFGNHDIERYKIKEQLYRVNTALPKKVVNELENIDNLKILRNNEINTVENGLTFCGTNFYDDSNYEAAIKYLNHNLPNFDNNTFNILLSHNPIIMNPEIFNELTEEWKCYVDCILSGHTHNGLFTPLLDKCLPGTRGFYIKSQGLFPKFTRGEFDVSESPLCMHADYTGIICPPVRTLPDRNFILRKTNDIIYNPGLQLVRIKKI